MKSEGQFTLLFAIALAALVSVPAFAQDKPAASKALTGPALEKAMADYKQKMKICTAAREKHEAVAVPYWERVDAKRKSRVAKRRGGETLQLSDYVLEQPPVYSGPPCPPDPSVRQEDQPEDRPDLPVVADFLRNAREHFGFVPEAPANEIGLQTRLCGYRLGRGSHQRADCARSIVSNPAAPANTMCRPGWKRSDPAPRRHRPRLATISC